MSPRPFTLLPFLILLGCAEPGMEPLAPDTTDPPNPPEVNDPTLPVWNLKSDKTNIAVLFVDYLSGEFEGGSLRNFAPRDSVIPDSLPFTLEFIGSGDISRIAFIYAPSGDCFFAGGIYWDNSVRVNMPVYIDEPDEFELLADSIALPEAVTCYDVFARGEGYPNDPDEFRIKAESGWRSVERLDIVRDFALHHFQVGFYLFPPAVKPFDLDDARWIIFLYQDRLE
jgi:hypothetical protein